MTLGSCVKGPDNMICREWVWKKACHWVLGRGLIRIFMEAHVKVNLACRAKPYMDGVCKACFLELSPSGISSSPAGNYVCKGFPLSASAPFTMILLPFYTSIFSRSSHTCQFLLIWGGYSSYQPSRQSDWGRAG